MPLSAADEKVIRRIREGKYKAYPEQRYVDPALMPGAIITFLSAIFLLFSFMGPGFGPIPFEIALLGTVIGLCILAPGIAVWQYYKRTYTFQGIYRFQLALSITALELANHGHEKVLPIISPEYPEEFRYLPLFVRVGPGNLLKRLQGVEIDSETLTKGARQTERFVASVFGLMGSLTLFGGIITLLFAFFLSFISGSMNLFLLVLAFLLLIMGFASLLYARLKIGALRRQELDATSSTGISSSTFSQMDDISPESQVEEVLSFLKSVYPHPFRLLVIDTYEDLEYTGRTYLTGNEIELREAILLPRGAFY